MIGHRAFSAKFTLDALPKHVHSLGDILYSLALIREDDVSKSYDNCQDYLRKFPRDGQLSANPEMLNHLKEELKAYFMINSNKYSGEPELAAEYAQSCIDQAILMTSPFAVIQTNAQGEIVFMGIAHGQQAADKMAADLRERVMSAPDWSRNSCKITIRVADDYVSFEE
ncbi:hypothetical protein RYA05_03830 [Pseudomonas syringae pv. actinidiae]|nr:hypothetical protein [Pseudomonas syringae pv. actinidiae]